ncbi:MAG: hypothetical protein R3E01_04125 [Pirellulaceae bacterium]
MDFEQSGLLDLDSSGDIGLLRDIEFEARSQEKGPPVPIVIGSALNEDFATNLITFVSACIFATYVCRSFGGVVYVMACVSSLLLATILVRLASRTTRRIKAIPLYVSGLAILLEGILLIARQFS